MHRLGFSRRDLDLTESWHVPHTSSTLPVLHPFNAIQRLETYHYLGNTLLRDGDVFGMATSLEIRVPFLDRDVLDWAFAIPGPLLLPSNTADKHLLRAACADLYSPDQLKQ